MDSPLKIPPVRRRVHAPVARRRAAQWGYLRDPVGTTVWFHLAGLAAHQPDAAAAAAAAAAIPVQMAATSASPVTYGGIV
jgi:hypothetical protein